MMNRSKKKVSNSIIGLRRVDRFCETEPCYKPHVKEVKTLLAQNTLHGVAEGETVSFDSLIAVPQNLETSNDRYCKVLQITYELKVTVETEGCSRSPRVKIPITIGTVGISEQEFSQIPT